MPDCDSSAQPNQEYDFMASIKRFRDCSAIGFWYSVRSPSENDTWHAKSRRCNSRK